MTRKGRYKVTFSIPSGVFNGFVAFSMEDIEDLSHARQIERALLDGGCTSVYLSVMNSMGVFDSVGPNDLPRGAISTEVQRMIASWRK